MVEKDSSNDTAKAVYKIDMWSALFGFALGAAFVYIVFKDKIDRTVETIGSQYKNDEVWQLNRGSDGRIANLRVSRDAQVGNDIGNSNIINDTHQLSPGYIPIEIPDYQGRIDVDSLTSAIQQKLEKRYMELNKKQSDLHRRQRFGMV